MEEYKSESHKTFADVFRGKKEFTFHPDYRGRNFYHGPAVSCEKDQVQEVIKLSPVPLQSDNLGYDVILYPK